MWTLFLNIGDVPLKTRQNKNLQGKSKTKAKCYVSSRQVKNKSKVLCDRHYTKPWRSVCRSCKFGLYSFHTYIWCLTSIHFLFSPTCSRFWGVSSDHTNHGEEEVFHRYSILDGPRGCSSGEERWLWLPGKTSCEHWYVDSLILLILEWRWSQLNKDHCKEECFYRYSLLDHTSREGW